MAQFFRIEKSWRGGRSTMYIRLARGEKLTEEMLESIGDNTNGGQENGYQIAAHKINALPEGERLIPRTANVSLY